MATFTPSLHTPIAITGDGSPDDVTIPLGARYITISADGTQPVKYAWADGAIASGAYMNVDAGEKDTITAPSSEGGLRPSSYTPSLYVQSEAGTTIRVEVWG